MIFIFDASIKHHFYMSEFIRMGVGSNLGFGKDVFPGNLKVHVDPYKYQILQK